MNFIYVIHLMCWNYLIDLSTHSRNRNNSIHCNNKGGARAKRAPPFIVSVPAVVSVSAVCDQVDRGDQVSAHQVDDINEDHELDPVQIDHIDDHPFFDTSIPDEKFDQIPVYQFHQHLDQQN